MKNQKEKKQNGKKVSFLIEQKLWEDFKQRVKEKDFTIQGVMRKLIQDEMKEGKYV